MAYTTPYHTSSTEYPPSHRNVHHNKTTCPSGQQIKVKELGTANKPLCEQCPTVD